MRKIGVRCLVSGRVQGVWFRGATRELAIRLGLDGYAENLSDGRVEVLVCGHDRAVEELVAWLWKGPPHARVADVVREDVTPLTESSGFRVR